MNREYRTILTARRSRFARGHCKALAGSGLGVFIQDNGRINEFIEQIDKMEAEAKKLSQTK